MYVAETYSGFALVTSTKVLCTIIYIDNMQSILLEQDVRLKIELAWSASFVLETWSVKPAWALQDDHSIKTLALTGQSEPRSALA